MPETLYTVPQVAERLHVHPHTVRAWIKAGDIGRVTIGRYHYVSESQLERFIGERTVD